MPYINILRFLDFVEAKNIEKKSHWIEVQPAKTHTHKNTDKKTYTVAVILSDNLGLDSVVLSIIFFCHPLEFSSFLVCSVFWALFLFWVWLWILFLFFCLDFCEFLISLISDKSSAYNVNNCFNLLLGWLIWILY